MECVLDNYSTCDLSDALQKLGIESYISNITRITSSTNNDKDASPSISGPAHTIEFVLSGNTTAPVPRLDQGHYIDCAPAGSIIVIKAPCQAVNAVFGGLLAARASYLGVKGVVVQGRVRDVIELNNAALPVYATATSTLGTTPSCRVSSIGECITLCQNSIAPVCVHNGDIIVFDCNGVVCVPRHLIEKIAQMCELNCQADAKVLQDLKAGISLKQAFATHRAR